MEEVVAKVLDGTNANVLGRGFDMTHAGHRVDNVSQVILKGHGKENPG